MMARDELISGLQQYTIEFVICFALTMYFSSKGDDDIKYKILDRKPTGEEAIRRIRFVFAKFFASIGGGILIGFFLKIIFSFTLSGDPATLLAVFCIFLAGLLIGMAQNCVRRIQGRQTRPLFDLIMLQHNLKLWFRPRH